MTIRYLCVLCDADRLAHIECRLPQLDGLARFEGVPGCLVLGSDIGRMFAVAEHGGVVLGSLFHRFGASVAIQQLGAGDSETIIATGGQHLLERFWGSYIAILPAPDGHIILRDPSGTLPCSYLNRDGVHVISSHPELMVEAGLLQPKFDSLGLARSLYLPGLPSERTALTGLQDLLPGMALDIRGRQTETRQCWNPWDHVSPVSRESAAQNAERLRRAVQSCISAWSHVHERALVGVSGGLDSSIVSAGLVRAGNSPSFLTMVTNDALGDERYFCRLLSRHLNAPLLEDHYSLEDIALDQPSFGHRPRPCGRLDAQSYDAAIGRAAGKTGAAAFFTGNGGDNVFYFSHSARGVVDRFLVEGPSAGVTQTARDICALTGASVFRLLGHFIRALRASRREYAWQPDVTFLAKSVQRDQMAQPVRHPWLTLPEDGGLPGKAAHIAMLMRMHHSIESYVERQGITVIHPLASQPVVELCLQIPTWQQCDGGQDRAVARRAFASCLPDEIVMRSGKGSPQGFAYEIARHFQSGIRERLLDGMLAREGIVDRQAIEVALRPDARNSGSTILRLASLVDAEAWIGHWQGGRQKPPLAANF